VQYSTPIHTMNGQQDKSTARGSVWSGDDACNGPARATRRLDGFELPHNAFLIYGSEAAQYEKPLVGPHQPMRVLPTRDEADRFCLNA
jgi:hypothetical protein